LVNKFSGERTFGVLTKIDLMDKGTDAVDVSSIIPPRSFSDLDSRMLLYIVLSGFSLNKCIDIQKTNEYIFS
jgi:hypothetical protein